MRFRGISKIALAALRRAFRPALPVQDGQRTGKIIEAGKSVLRRSDLFIGSCARKRHVVSRVAQSHQLAQAPSQSPG